MATLGAKPNHAFFHCQHPARKKIPRRTSAPRRAHRRSSRAPLSITCARRPGDRHARKKTSFFQRFYLRHAARIAFPHRSETMATMRIRPTCRRVNAALSYFRRMVDFSCRTTPIARKCANFSTRFAVPKRRIAHVETVSRGESRRVRARDRHQCRGPTRSGFASRADPKPHRGGSEFPHPPVDGCRAKKKKPLADNPSGFGVRRAQRTAGRSRECRFSDRLLPAIRRSRPARADR